MPTTLAPSVVLMTSSEGCMDIEEVAVKYPELIHQIAIDLAVGLTDAEASSISIKVGIPAVNDRLKLIQCYRA